MVQELTEKIRKLETRIDLLKTENERLAVENEKLRQAEETLRESEVRYRTLVEQANDAIFLENEQDEIIDVNRRACDLLGYSRQELLSMTVPQLQAPEVRGQSGSVIKQELAESGASPFETVDLHRNGTRIPVEVSTSRIEGQTGNLVLSVVRDITERKQAEQALRESEQRFRNIVEASPMGMYLYELQPDNRLVLIGSNPAADQILGVDNSNFIGLTIEQAFPPLAETEVPARYRQAAAKGISWETEEIEYEHGEIVGSFEVYAFQTSPGKMAVLFTDITERKQAEAALRQSEERFRRIFEQGPLGMGILSPDDRFIKINPRLRQMLGYREEELTGLTYLDFTHPDDVESSKHLARQLLSREVTYIQTEKRYLTKAGEILWIHLTATFIRDEQGQPLHKLTMIEDITARKQAEAELRWLKEFNESIVQTMAEGITVEDEAGDFIFVNPAAADLLGYTVDDLIGRHWTEVIPADQQPIVQAANQRRAQGQTDRYELEAIRRDGRRITVLVSGTPRFEADRFAGTVAVFADITKRARAERLLQALNQAALVMAQALTVEEIFAAAAKALKPLGLSCMVSLLDQSRNRLLPTYLSYDRKIVGIAERLLNVKRENFSMPVDTVDVYRQVVRDKQTVLAEDVKKLLRQLLPEPLKRFAGRMVRILKVPQAIFAPLIIEEKVIGIFSVQADDLTEEEIPAMTVFAHQIAAAWRKVTLLQSLEESLAELESTQDQLLQAQKMEAIGQLAGGIAHDFNNLLTAINGFAGLMQMSLSTDDPLWEMTEKILDSGQRAAGLIRQLLAFSRKQIIEPQVLILNSVVTDMEKMLRRLIGEDIQLETSLSLALWPVKVDPTQMGQIIVNLALNARDAMPTGGRLTIETANVMLDEAYAAGHLEAQPGEYVRLAVSDTGHGIKKEVQSRIFEPFFTTKEAGQGSGLGLATVYGIVKQSGGDIQVYSEVNQGTTFKIYLPRTPEAVRPAHQPAEEQELPSGEETILLVEDDESVRNLSRRVLESRGYSLLEARRGVEALRLSAGYAGPIHLLLTDVVMPDMGGKVLAEQITATRPDMKVVYMSGYTDNAIARHGVLEPGVPFLQKPFSPKELARKVRAVLDN